MPFDVKTMVNMTNINACSIGSKISKKKFKGSGRAISKNGIWVPRASEKLSRAVNRRLMTITPARIFPKIRQARVMGNMISLMMFSGNINA